MYGETIYLLNISNSIYHPRLSLLSKYELSFHYLHFKIFLHFLLPLLLRINSLLQNPSLVKIQCSAKYIHIILFL